MNKYFQTVITWLRSRQFFIVVLSIFIFEAVWIAVSARYPMAFDEEFHLGIIQLYAHHLSPFFAHQPAGANSFGAVVRDPSYLYHYLMSFPWRLVVRMVHGTTTQIIIMRIINITFVATGLVVLRRALVYTKASSAVINTVLLFLVLTPLMPFVAAQINYDNLLFLLVAVTTWLSLKYLDILKQNKQLDIRMLTSLLVVCLLTSLVKYSFLPIFLALMVYLTVGTWRAYAPAPIKSILIAIKNGWQVLSLPTKIILSVLLILSLGLFMERDGYNTLKYLTPAPECDQVIGAAACGSYGPWQRNEVYLNTKQSRAIDNDPISFAHTWFGAYYYALFSTLNGPESSYELGTALPVPYYAGQVVALLGLVAVLVTWHLLRKRYRYFGLLVWVTIVYIVVLWIQNYTDFVHLGESTALQGRYLLLVLAFIYLLITVGIKQSFEHYLPRLVIIKPIILVIVLLCILEGGGVLTYILRSNQHWYWRNNKAAIRVNQAAQRAVIPLIVGAKIH